MPYYCTVPRCTSMAGKAKNVSFHQFPRDEELAKLWNNILKRGKPYTKYSKVCSLHFRPEDYTVTSVGKNKGQWRTLRKDAIPSQNLPSESPPDTHHRRRSSGAWVPSSLPPSTVDSQMQQQMAQAIYLQTMLAMQAATNGPQHIPIPVDPTESTTQQKQSPDIADHRHIDGLPDENIQGGNHETQNSDHSIQEVSNQYKKTSYKCEECSKCFKDPDVFVLHKRTHIARSLAIQENLPATMTGQEKENFNTNSEFSSQETLRANPILANLLKSGISSRVPEMSNNILESNNILSIENQIMTALAVNMESYIRNLSTMLTGQAKETPNSRIEHDTNRLSPNSEQVSLNSEQDDHNSEDYQNSDQDEHNSLHDHYNCVDEDIHSADRQHSLQNYEDSSRDLKISINKTDHLTSSQFPISDCQNSVQDCKPWPESENSPLRLQNYQNSDKYLTQNSTEDCIFPIKNCQESQDETFLQEDQNNLVSQGSIEEPSCDKQDLNESKDSNTLLIDENV